MECYSPSGKAKDGYVVYEGSKQVTNFNVSASCAIGYKGHAKVSVCTPPGTMYILTGCEPKKCVTPRSGEIASYDLSVFSLEVPSFSVSARCRKSRLPDMTPRVIPCKEDGDEFSVEGCLPGSCVSPTNAAKEAGYVVYEASLILGAFQVRASCADGYKGTARVTVCPDFDTPYSLSGCAPEKCTEPSLKAAEGYLVTTHSLDLPKFSVSVKCKNGIGLPRARECLRDGEPYTLEGCYFGACVSPRKGIKDGYVVYEKSKQVSSFHVSAMCAAGYKGSPLVKRCNSAEEPYTLAGCVPEKCVEPKLSSLARYELTTLSLERPSFSVSAKCKSGFGTAETKECKKDGEPFSLEGCNATCASPRLTADHGYVVLEKMLDMDLFDVSAHCASGYKGTPTISPCTRPNQKYTVSGCTPLSCTEPSAESKSGYDLTIHSMEGPSFSVSAKCLSGGMGMAKLCVEDGQPFTLEGCQSSCTSPRNTITHGYVMFEKSLLTQNFSVVGACADGYKGTPSVVKCAAAGQPYDLSGCSPIQCTEPSDEDKLGYDFTTHSMAKPMFSVTTKCQPGTAGKGVSKPCSKDGEPFVLEGCLASCTSPKQKSEDGYVMFEKSMLMKEFNVHAVCADGYKGNATVVKCTGASQPYSLSGCSPVKCAEPPEAEKANYKIEIFSLEKPSFSVTAKCKDGSGSGKAVPCTVDKEAYKLEGCDAVRG